MTRTAFVSWRNLAATVAAVPAATVEAWIDDAVTAARREPLSRMADLWDEPTRSDPPMKSARPDSPAP